MSYKHVKLPEGGEKISIIDGKLSVPDNPILGFVEGDGIGPDITMLLLESGMLLLPKPMGQTQDSLV